MCITTKDFLDIENEHKDKLLSLDFEVTENFVEAPNALSLCFQKAKEGEASLPTKEEEEHGNFLSWKRRIATIGSRKGDWIFQSLGCREITE